MKAAARKRKKEWGKEERGWLLCHAPFLQKGRVYAQAGRTRKEEGIKANVEKTKACEHGRRRINCKTRPQGEHTKAVEEKVTQTREKGWGNQGGRETERHLYCQGHIKTQQKTKTKTIKNPQATLRE